MENNDFEKRLGFLKKSYERVPSTFDSEKVLRKIDEETNKTREEKPTIKKVNKFGQKVTVWVVSIASIFIIGFISVAYMAEQHTSGEQEVQSVITDDYLEKLKEDYTFERENRRKLLGLEEGLFSELEFIGYADMNYSFVTNADNIERAKSSAEGKEGLARDVEGAILALKLPSEMVETLKENPLVGNREKSIEFLAEYRDKIQDLIILDNKVLDEHRDEVIQNSVESPTNNGEVIINHQSNYPKQLQQIIDSMEKQSIHLYKNKYTDEIVSGYDDSDYYHQVKNAVHPDTISYVEMILQEPYTFGENLKYSLDKSVEIILSMQHTLLNVEKEPTLYSIMESYFITIFNNLMKGSGDQPIFNEQGQVKEEYRDLWRKMAVGERMTPLKYVINPIIEEMEASDWKQSKSYDALDYTDLKDALVIGRDGKLK
ncbi:hypothetical protein FITA111629_09480 [Filibacter tadaridae]|uniref:Uncharacterized protein n=1 Tax=Filibacter tadaridae TaxID=2483811 RepID=A0A3P5XNG1_9BACL|nr:hypothetical protein [Filibacter tadaridae]VDC31891.1 hypothetical protein FILTAD_02497 [Filibacter tadaridae]